MARPANTDVSREVVAVVTELTERYGPLYAQRVLVPNLLTHLPVDERSEDAARGMLCDASACLRALFGEYAFSRRGKERDELAAIAVKSLDRTLQEGDLLGRTDAEDLWLAFENACEEAGRKPMEQINRGVVQGLAELAQEVSQDSGCGSIALWVVEAARRTGRIEAQFMRMVDVRGVGPKLASLFLRDVVYLFNLEPRIEPMDRLYYQPIDKWIRGVAEFIVEDYEHPADWILAGKIAKIVRKSGVSGPLFNMGTTYFGSREAHSAEQFADAIEDIMRLAAVA